MNTELISIILRGTIILGAAISIIYTLGVVWRVEKKLDLSYKLFLVAIISFAFSEIAGILKFQQSEFINLGLKIIFILFFLAGTLEMRNMIRRLDGEK